MDYSFKFLSLKFVGIDNYSKPTILNFFGKKLSEIKYVYSISKTQISKSLHVNTLKVD